MSSPYQLILMNLIHIQACLLGCARTLALVRRQAPWRESLLNWRQEQDRQLRVLLVLFRQIGGQFGFFHRLMLQLAALVGLGGGLVLAFLPLFVIRPFFRQCDNVLIEGLERASDQIALAEWQVQSSINPPKVLLELVDARREWLLKWEGVAQFL